MLDIMSWVKLNGLHWCTQSITLSLPRFTWLVAEGPYRATSIYTVLDVSDIVQYAGERGIAFMLEIDIPDHTSFIGSAHPGFIACFDASS